MNALISAVFPVLAKKSSATPFFFFAAMMLIDFILVATVYPETKGVSLKSWNSGWGSRTDGIRSYISKAGQTLRRVPVAKSIGGYRDWLRSAHTWACLDPSQVRGRHAGFELRG